MRKLAFIGLLTVATCLFTYPVSAAGESRDQHPAPTQQLYSLANGQNSGFTTGASVLQGKAQGDTIYLLGGPNRDDGDFESATSGCDWDGWTTADLTVAAESVWHCSDYHCDNLDPDTVPNHAWWCGMMYNHDCETGDYGGYGNIWTEWLDWYGTVPDNSLPAIVTVSAMLNYDVEPGYDFLYFQHETPTQMATDEVYTGADTVAVDITITLAPTDYVGADFDEVHLRWSFKSDSGWSDEDCLWPTFGAAQVDLIEVYFDQGGGPIQQGVTEDCEGGPTQWINVATPGVGDFAQIWSGLQDIDPCRSNLSCLVAFIDDGEVVPGTGGYLCTTWCYGPSGYIVNPEGGLAGPEFGIKNQIWSPVLTWPGDQYTAAAFEFDVYRHETLSPTAPAIFYVWHVRSTDSSNPDDIQAAEWKDRDFVYYGGPDWLRVDRENDPQGGGIVTDLLVAGRRFVQLAFGVRDLGFTWGWPGTDGYPAPYFDNAAFLCWGFDGPGVSAREIELFQDNFPEIGSYDYGDLAANSIRFDSAMSKWINMPADSIIVDVTPVRTGAVLNDMPKLYYKLFPNPVFDPVRTFPNEGWVYGDSTNSIDAFSFDLPDTGFFFPGDVIHYYIEGQDNVAGDIGTTLLPGDTTSFSGPVGYPNYHSRFRVQGLPSFTTLSVGAHPKILFWNDFAARGGESEWYLALQNSSYQQGTDFDVYYTNGPSTGLGNGLGGRATSTQLSGYEVILYTCGDLFKFTIANGDAETWQGDDVGVLDSWLRQGGPSIPRNMFLTGDNLLFDMVTNSGAVTQQFVSNWIGAMYLDQNIRPEVDYQAAPLVQPLANNSLNLILSSWIAYGGCNRFNTFDAVMTEGSTEKIAEFLDPSGSSGHYEYAAMTYRYDPTFNARVVYCPYDLMFVYTDPDHPPEGNAISARAQLLKDVLLAFGHIGPSTSTPVPEAGVFTVKSYPNPFNPSAKIQYSMPRRGELTIKIYNLRGELVRILIDEVVIAGEGFVMWDGSDSRGQAVASGAYFYEAVAAGSRHAEKLMLVK